ncbi:MAG: hypothetical protein Q9183_001890 [Haloplaca sp. 2 TL-2023]
MFDSVCTFPLPSDVFTQAIHPTPPLVALGLASGHVQLHQLSALPSNSSPKSKAKTASTNGHGTIETAWRTRRHKGSCRSVVFNADGSQLFSAGTDGIAKCAEAETGKVISKVAVATSNDSGDIDAPTLLSILNPQILLLAADSSALHLYDLRSQDSFRNSKPQQTYHPHDDYVSSISPLSPSETSTSGVSRQWFSTGGSTVAITDVRKGVVYQSEDLGEELLSGCVIDEKLIAGGEKGVLRVWDGGTNGMMEGKERRVAVQRGESLDVMCSIPGDVVPNKTVCVGLGDGTMKFVDVGDKKGAVVAGVRHHEIDGAVALGFESGGRLISSGGDVVKIWERSEEEDSDDEELAAINGVTGLGSVGEDNEPEADSDGGSSEEERKPKRKKRKRNKGKYRGGNSHIMAFKGMD